MEIIVEFVCNNLIFEVDLKSNIDVEVVFFSILKVCVICCMVLI